MLVYHFTWMHYWLLVAVVLLVYYVALAGVYYRQEAQRFLAGKREQQGGLGLEEEFALEEFDEGLVGSVADEYGVSTVGSDEIGFAPRKAVVDADEELQGLVPDVLEEVKSIIHTVETEDGTKVDFISLFKLVSSKYSRMKESHHLEAVNDWIRENVPFYISDEELEALWE